MIRTAEAVLDGHPDKFMDILADRLLAEGYAADPDCYGQIEGGVWSDCLWLSGLLLTRRQLRLSVADVVTAVGRQIGYTGGNHVDVSRYRIRNEICQEIGDPRPYTDHANDQCITVGWAGYDALTHYLPPEQYLAHSLRLALVASCRAGPLRGQGPDGKLLVRLREEGSRWLLEHVLVTIQQREEDALLDVIGAVGLTLSQAYTEIRARDPRWRRDWEEVELLANPNGPLLNGGSDGDNGQTGRKLVMDYYGPRVPIGGGALSGKVLAHIDRAAAYGARFAALQAVAGGAECCQVTLAYAPGRDVPLDIQYDMAGRGPRLPADGFRHSRLAARFRGGRFRSGINVGRLGHGIHFFDPELPWNQVEPN